MEKGGLWMKRNSYQNEALKWYIERAKRMEEVLRWEKVPQTNSTIKGVAAVHSMEGKIMAEDGEGGESLKKRSNSLAGTKGPLGPP